MDTQPEPLSVDPHRLSTRRRSIVLATCGVCLGLAIVATRDWSPRQSAVRTETHAILRSVAEAAKLFERDSGTPPTIDSLLAAGMLDRAALRPFARAELLAGPPPGTAPGTAAPEGEEGAITPLLVQDPPCRAVKAGEAWGGPGETTDRDIPACRFVLMSDWSIRAIDESEFARTLAPSLRLTPL